MDVVGPQKSSVRSLLFPVFALYAAALSITAYMHESWFDEGQAWLMARDLSPFQLWFHYIRYEGTPALWHTVLMIPAKLGFPWS
jgi:hypothetical protein